MRGLRLHWATHDLPMRQWDWVNEFKRIPKSAVMPENIDKVHDIILVDMRVKVRELGKALGIPIDRVHFILHHELHMKELCARWVPHLCTLEQKRNRMRTSAKFLQLFKNSADFLRCFVKMDKTWIQYYWRKTAVKTGQKFVCNEAAIQLVNDCFEGLEENHFREGIKNLEKRWTKCVELRRDYVKK